MVFFFRFNLFRILLIFVFSLCVMSLPAGFKFAPTEEELVLYYLDSKVFQRPLPDVIKEYSHSDIFGKSPNDVEMCRKSSRKEGYFFITDFEFDGRNEITVGNGIGFWKSIGGEIPLFNLNGDIFSLKTILTYFSGRSPKEAKKTHWRMEVFRLPHESYAKTNSKGGKWALGRVRRGQEYSSHLQ